MKQFAITLMLLALMIAPACDTLEEIDLRDEPAPTFVKPVYVVDDDNHIVTDTTTNGIMWQKCAYGETGADCSGDYAKTIAYNYAVDNSAVDYCNSATTGGYTDWRLPTIGELDSLAYTDVTYNWFRNYNTAPNPPNPPTSLKSQYWWSSTFENINFVYALRLSDKDAQYSAVDGNTPRYVRCARSIQP